MTTLGDLLTEAQPGFACGTQDEQGLFQFRMNNVTRSGHLDLSKRRKVPSNAHSKIGRFLLRQTDVLFNATNSSDGVGKSVVVGDLDEPAVFSNHFLRLRTDPDRLDSRYLARWLHWNFERGVFEAMCRQWVNQATVSREALMKMDLQVPPLAEQRRIATFLDQTDALLAKRRQALVHLDDLTESTFHAMFSGESVSAIVGDVAHHDKGAVRTGPFGSQLLHEEFVDEGIAVLGLDNVVGNEFRWGERRFITSEKYQQLARYTVHPGDVLISIMGTTGRCVVVPGDIGMAINTKHICAITVDSERIMPSFLRAAFLWHSESREHLRRQTKGSIMDGLNMGIVKSMPVPVPPMKRQIEFDQRVAEIDMRRARLARAAQEGNNLMASLQARAFRGEL